MVINLPFPIGKVYIPQSEIEGTSLSDTTHL